MERSFTAWLSNEVKANRAAAIALLEKRDKLKYIESPALKEEYMIKIGQHEQDVLCSELEVFLLENKAELIQTYINRREPIDLKEIEKQLNTEKEKRLKELSERNASADERNVLSDEELKELDEKYCLIVRTFHPEINSDISETEKELYYKALEAYRHLDIISMRLLYEMLFGINDMKSLYTQLSDISPNKNREIKDNGAFEEYISSDYTLAAALYPNFSRTEDDIMLIDMICNLKDRCARLEEEVKTILASFPFIAKDTLASEAKIEEYLAELKVRMKQSLENKALLVDKIDRMIGENGLEQQHS